MSRIPLLLFSIITTFFVITFALAAVQPRHSAHLYVPIQNHNYLTVDNRSASWVIRIGDVGGINGFDMAFTETNPNLNDMRAKHVPFPVNWVIDWCFQFQRRSPYFLMITPLYFPPLILGVWPIWYIIQRSRNATQAASDNSANDSPYSPPSTDGGLTK